MGPGDHHVVAGVDEARGNRAAQIGVAAGDQHVHALSSLSPPPVRHRDLRARRREPALMLLDGSYRTKFGPRNVSGRVPIRYPILTRRLMWGSHRGPGGGTSSRFGA